MKYGILTMDYPRAMYNIGDAMQILAVKNLYREMGVSEQELVRLPVSLLSTYQGEPIILPINFPMYGFYELSDNIVPVYLGISLMSGTAASGLRLKANEPIGCRDAHTYQELRKENIYCYYAGCMTLTLPQRDLSIDGDKVLFVDIPDGLKKYIPDKHWSDAEFLSHIIYETESPEREAESRLKYYRDHARLVVTSRIHCALPCIASGIPTIFVCEQRSFRYSVLESLLHIYMPSDFANIDWNPEPVRCDQLKENMLQYARKRIDICAKGVQLPLTAHRFYQKMLSRYFSISTEIVYENTTIASYMHYLEGRFSPNDSFQYILWGVTQLAELAYREIQATYPSAVLAEVVDEFKEILFHDKWTTRSETIRHYPSAIVLVTAGAASIDAEKFFHHVRHQNYCICYGGLYVEDGKTISFPGLPTKSEEN